MEEIVKRYIDMKLANLRASNEELIKDFNISVEDFNFKVKSDDWVGVTYEQFSKILNDKKQKYIINDIYG